MGAIENVRIALNNDTSVVDRGDGSFVVGNGELGKGLVLSKEQVDLVRRFDGRQLLDIAHESFEASGKVRFSLLLNLVRNLARVALIEDGENILKILGEPKNTDKKNDLAIQGRTILSFGKSAALQGPKSSDSKGVLAPVLLSAVLCIAALAVFAFKGPPWLKAFLQPARSAELGLLVLYSGLALALTLRATARFLHARFLGVQGVSPRLAFSAGILFPDPGSGSWNALPRSSRIVSAVWPFFMIFLFAALFEFIARRIHPTQLCLAQCLNLLSAAFLFVLFMDLRPFGASMLHEIWSIVTRSRLSDHGMAYLGKKSARRLLQRDFFEGEFTLILFVTYAIVWGMLAYLLISRIITDNLLQLFQVFLSGGSIISMLVAALFLLALGATLLATAAYGVRIIGGLFLSIVPPKRPTAAFTSADEPTRKQILEFLRKVPLFHTLDETFLEYISNSTRRLPFRKGDYLIHQGDEGDSFYILLSGRAEVIFEEPSGLERQLAEIGSGDSFGEIALLEAVPRTASVRAVEEGLALQLSRDAFAAVAKDKGGEELTAIIRGTGVLNNSPLFSDMDPESMSKLLSRFKLVRIPKDREVFHRGDAGDRFYLVLDGKLNVLAEDEKTVIATLQKGDPFGEIALVKNVPRTATVISRTDSSLLALDSKDFFDTFEQSLALGERIEELGEDRLSEMEG